MQKKQQQKEKQKQKKLAKTASEVMIWLYKCQSLLWAVSFYYYNEEGCKHLLRLHLIGKLFFWLWYELFLYYGATVFVSQ